MITRVDIIIIYRIPRKKLRITVEYVGHISLALVGRLASCDWPRSKLYLVKHAVKSMFYTFKKMLTTNSVSL